MLKLIATMALLFSLSSGSEQEKIKLNGAPLLKMIDMQLPVFSEALMFWIHKHNINIDELTQEQVEDFAASSEFPDIYLSVGLEWCKTNKNSMFCIDKEYLKKSKFR